MVSLNGNENAPVVAGACKSTQQCKLDSNTNTFIARSETAWNVFSDGKLVGSFIGFKRANDFAASVLL